MRRPRVLDSWMVKAKWNMVTFWKEAIEVNWCLLCRIGCISYAVLPIAATVKLIDRKMYLRAEAQV